MRRIVIVGAGLAGGSAAVALREAGFDGKVTLIGDEPGAPFGRPPLSKTYLRGEEDLAGWLVRPASWYAENAVDVVQAAVTQVDAEERRVRLESGDSAEYDALLIATGGRNRQLEIPGAGLGGVHQLRTVADCEALRRAAQPGRRATLVGMGFIGCEVAASLSQMGLQVSAILPGRLPLATVLGEEAGEALAGIHREHGVRLLTEDQAVAIEGTERASAVVTRGGARISCDLVVVGVGISPRLPAALPAGLERDNGILVDERCQSTIPGVFAAGDVANQRHPLFGRIRVEHYNNAEKQGRAAAQAMLGHEEPYSYVHSFWSDQYDHKIEYVGHAARWERLVVRGSTSRRRFLAFYLEGGRLLAAMGLDRGGDPEVEPESELAACARLIAARAEVSHDQLADESMDLWRLVPPA